MIYKGLGVKHEWSATLKYLMYLVVDIQQKILTFSFWREFIGHLYYFVLFIYFKMK